jgi:succinate-semialdehyde dehydrogenase/glutarate-semialdehyde dehydrogenase
MSAAPALPTASLYIGGRWSEASSGERADAVSPATGEVIGTVAQGTREDVDRAAQAARDAWPGWAARSAFERAAALERVADALDRRRDDLARTLSVDQGKPLATEARAEVDEAIEYARMAAGDVRRLDGLMPPSVSADKRVLVYRVPRGVVSAITPWNWPYAMAAELIAPAIAAGNAVVWTPAPTTALCAQALAECIEEAELPPGVFNLVTGEGAVVGDAAAGHPLVSAVGFIGSIETGLSVARRAAGKAQLLELGGNGPCVVLDDADLDLAVEATLTSCFLCSGQSCIAGERLLVHEAVHGEFVERLARAIEREVRLGDPLDPATTMGPVNNEGVAAKMDAHVADALERGARLLTGGRRDDDRPTRLYWQPTLLDAVDADMAVAREETFGPVAPVLTIRSEADALAAVEDSPHGLLCSVFTRDLGRALRFAERVRVGWVNINATTNYWESHLPFGGRAGSLSGVGRAGGRFALEGAFTELKTVVFDVREGD